MTEMRGWKDPLYSFEYSDSLYRSVEGISCSAFTPIIIVSPFLPCRVRLPHSLDPIWCFHQRTTLAMGWLYVLLMWRHRWQTQKSLCHSYLQSLYISAIFCLPGQNWNSLDFHHRDSAYAFLPASAFRPCRSVSTLDRERQWPSWKE